MRHRSAPTGRRARFFWQGALIILPALVLAGAGLHSLRQDDVLARHEAGEQARQIATELAQRLIPQALLFDLPDAVAVRRPPAVPEDEVLHRLLRSPLISSAVLTEPDGRVIYPPEPAAMPPPAPLDEGELSPGQQNAWLVLEESWRGETAASERDLVHFLATAPPARFAGLAQFRTALALAQSGQLGSATSLLRTTRETPESMVGESGVPLRWLSEWKLAALLPESGRIGALQTLASRLLQNPSPVAVALMAKIAPLHPTMHDWELVQTAHQTALEFAAALAAEPSPQVMLFRGEPQLIVHQPAGSAQWALAISLEALHREVERLDRSMVRPPAFGVAVSAGPQPLLTRPADNPALAQATSESVPVTVEVFLKDPAAFDAQRRTKTQRFAALIALSAAAVVIGFLSAWRAFRRQQQLSELKSNFVASVSHELRAPIASVRLMAEELQHGAAPSREKTQQYVRFISQECRRLSAVIENVLDFSRREQGREQFDFEPTDLAALVEETTELMRTYGSERSVRLASVIQGAPPPVVADGRALQRLLVNLIDNAQKHAPSGSEVKVGLDFDHARVSLWVEDTGPGIPRDEQNRIFERFYRIGSELQRQTQGVGLGLSIVKHLAEVHGGRVSVRSAVGQGSRFIVDLPLRRSPISNSHPLPA